MKYLLIIPILIYLVYPRPDNTLYNNQVRAIAHDLLTQCIPDYRARKIPVIVCYNLHDKYLRDNLR